MITNEGNEIANFWKDDPCFERAESWVPSFCDKDSIFYNRFDELDISSVVEFVGGHGRHVDQYVDKAGSITLVDVKEDNIDYCRKCLKKHIEKIFFYQNTGNDFNAVPSSSVTAIFTYDAMARFNLIDILSYLQDAYRILVPGGKILYHHSNNYEARLGESLLVNTHARNFMTDKIFTCLAMTVGFKVLSQDIMDWGTDEWLDCLSLCEKPWPEAAVASLLAHNNMQKSIAWNK